MPEDLLDRLDDFDLMLEGFCARAKLSSNDKSRERLLAYWYSLMGEAYEALGHKSKGAGK